MPALTPPALILVTGASGFLGPHIIKALLAAGFTVRGTARDEVKAAYLTNTFGIDVAIVPDGAAPGAYDVAVKGVAGVVHAASPLDVTNTGDPDLVILPAKNGTISLLASCATSTVQRVVQISSLAAVTNSNWAEGRVTLTEDAWNDEAPAICAAQGAATHPFIKYIASKAVAERAFWQFFEKPRAFDGIALDCALIFGEPLGYAASKGRLEGSNALLLPYMTSTHTEAELRAQTAPCVGADEVAATVVRALTVPEASGRFLVSSGPVYFNDYAIAAAVLDNPNLTPGHTDDAYRTGLGEQAVTCDTGKAQRVLGITYKHKDVVLADAMRAIKPFLTK
ncbi:dihydrokaempferol 4-reductase [Cutaneotrichosporon oleaginosum]|uniref:Dihydrokaempferol 4-reductase n=1 Tax=Cutaneotrichosporon oleaginosum TaxID=879819 RepID=A0A0J0XWW8_9TREE|nr:dihydrokaempferol 4-reductase [Cutaneotrichosporon oleaginosum]KLT45562.1 dihydrokaempferol 4-reductase [Cutaneotrichosporon oleaginosum]